MDNLRRKLNILELIIPLWKPKRKVQSITDHDSNNPAMEAVEATHLQKSMFHPYLTFVLQPKQTPSSKLETTWSKWLKKFNEKLWTKFKNSGNKKLIWWNNWNRRFSPTINFKNKSTLFHNKKTNQKSSIIQHLSRSTNKKIREPNHPCNNKFWNKSDFRWITWEGKTKT